MKINYVIATYNGKCNRNHKYPSPEDVLKSHVKKILSLETNISQITIMKASSINYYKNYYNINDIVKKSNIPIKIIECENFGYSEGQWLKAYEIYKNKFDYYLFMEDDYCPNMENFDQILIECYKNKFSKNIGLLCALVEGSSDYKNTGTFPIHWEGCVFTNKETLCKLYQEPKWNGDPRKYLDLIDKSIDNGYNWEKIRKSYLGGYYQLTFSHLFTLSNIEHEDYLDLKKYNNLLQFPYWADMKNEIGGKIWFFNKGDTKREKYTIDDIYNSPIIPIQLFNVGTIKFNTPLSSFPTEIYPERICLDIVDHFKPYIKNKIVCDIGCGAGDILEYIRLRKLCKEVKGVEIQKTRYNKSRTYITFGDVFKKGIPEADVYILWLGIGFPYGKLLQSLKKDVIIFLLDSKDRNHIEFQKNENIKLIQKISFNYNEINFINPDNKDKYIELLKKKYQSINSDFKITGSRFFCVYKFTKKINI